MHDAIRKTNLIRIDMLSRGKMQISIKCTDDFILILTMNKNKLSETNQRHFTVLNKSMAPMNLEFSSIATV